LQTVPKNGLGLRDDDCAIFWDSLSSVDQYFNPSIECNRPINFYTTNITNLYKKPTEAESMKISYV